MRRLLVILVLSRGMSAEQLPIRSYSSADGLPHNRIQHILPDPQGFIWFCTSGGLSRFDGHTFTNFGVAQGLPHHVVLTILRSRNGNFWVGTQGGLSRLVRTGAHAFENAAAADPAARMVTALLEARDGTIWVGTARGVYRVVGPNRATWRMEPASVAMGSYGFAEDERGRLWIGTGTGLFRRLPDGHIEAFGTREQLGSIYAALPMFDHTGRLWIGTSAGLYRLVANPTLGKPAVEHLLTTADGLASNDIKSLLETPDGALWVGAIRVGLTRLTRIGAEFQARVFTPRNGLTEDAVLALASDSAGNLWVGTDSAGAVRISPGGFVRYTDADGLPGLRADSVFQTITGQVCVTSGEVVRAVACFDGRRFHAVQPRYRSKVAAWSQSQVMLQARSGEWWAIRKDGPERFPAVPFEDLARTRPKMRDAAGSVPAGAWPAMRNPVRIFEDSRGDVWIGLQERRAIFRWDRASNRFVRCREGGSRDEQLVGAFGEDLAGNVWVGLSGDGVLRYRNGAFDQFTVRDGAPAGGVLGLLCDRQGRLWMASTEGGLGRVDGPNAERPAFRTYAKAQGLVSNFINCLADDQWGRIYACTTTGVDRLDPPTGAIRHYSAALGFPPADVYGALRDRSNQLLVRHGQRRTFAASGVGTASRAAYDVAYFA